MISVKTFQFNLLAENTYLLYDETKESVIIDCGCLSEREEKVLSNFISQNDLILKRLLCTHLHFDHVLGNAFIHQAYGIKPEAHRNEVTLLPSVKEQIQFMMNMPVPVHFIDVEDFIEDNEIIRFGQSELTALLVPGHSPGSLAFYSPKDDFIVAGDVLFQGSIGRTDLWGGNYNALITAIKEKILPLPDETVVYPGHGPSTSVIEEKTNNPFIKT
jgi:glyoxylase-like metal-dependent hydrolase (beta-lactamase superfamily II)